MMKMVNQSHDTDKGTNNPDDYSITFGQKEPLVEQVVVVNYHLQWMESQSTNRFKQRRKIIDHKTGKELEV